MSANEDYEQELYVSDEEKYEKTNSQSLQVMFINSKSEDPSIPMADFRKKMIDVINQLIDRFGEDNIEFHLSDDKVGYQEVLLQIIEGTHIQKNITETKWPADRRVPLVEIFKQRNEEMISKLVTIRNEYTGTNQFILAMDTPTNFTAINENMSLAKDNNIPYTYFSLDMNVIYFLDNLDKMTPRKKYHAKRPIAYSSNNAPEPPSQHNKRFRSQNFHPPQPDLPLMMTPVLPVVQPVPVIEGITYERNEIGKPKTMIIRVALPE